MLDLLLALTLVVASAGAPADPKAEFPTPSPTACDKQFSEFDGNRDGALSVKEYVEGRWGQLRFASVPSEADIRMHKRRYTEQAAWADANKDGKLSRAEHRKLCQSGLDGP